MEYTKYSESPDIFHFWTGVSTIAGILQRKVWIDQRFFQWTPNFYIVLVAPPGVVAKSTSSGIGSDLLWQVEGVTKGPDSATWHGLGVAFEKARTLIPIETEGTSPLDQPYLEMSCVTSSISELGTFLKPQDDDMTMFITDMWDGKLRPWQHTTKSSGEINIKNPWLNVIGCTTTAWMARHFTEDMIGGGLVSRVIFVYAEDKRQLTAYLSDVIDKEKHDAFAARLVDDLRVINELVGEFQLTPEAKQFGREWYTQHWSERPLHMASERYSGYIARKQTHIHKLAMVLSAAERDDLTIDVAELSAAERIITALEQDMAKVFEAIGVADTSKYITEIVSLIRAHRSISQKDLYRRCYTTMAIKDFQEACDAAVRAGFIRVVNKGGEYWFYPIFGKETQDEPPAQASEGD